MALRRLDGVEAGGAVKEGTDRGTTTTVRRRGETNKTSTARAVTSARAPYVRSTRRAEGLCSHDEVDPSTHVASRYAIDTAPDTAPVMPRTRPRRRVLTGAVSP